MRPGKGWTDYFCDCRKSILARYESAGGRRPEPLGSGYDDNRGRSRTPVCTLFNAEWNEMSDDEVVTGTNIASLISMRIR